MNIIYGCLEVDAIGEREIEKKVKKKWRWRKIVYSFAFITCASSDYQDRDTSSIISLYRHRIRSTLYKAWTWRLLLLIGIQIRHKQKNAQSVKEPGRHDAMFAKILCEYIKRKKNSYEKAFIPRVDDNKFDKQSKREQILDISRINKNILVIQNILERLKWNAPQFRSEFKCLSEFDHFSYFSLEKSSERRARNSFAK